ncbi:hypothetical protein [Sphingobacterium multivorum]|uniref:hypothetical protein n=1 Tax=Sphingobacterium multivorum TaxID=28454 RepID=UPI00289892BA|nr:hypothetical protein [Sphingobacterium multivorum]
MKTFIYLCITAMFSAGALLAATTMSNPWPVFAVVVGVWVLFVRGEGNRDRENARRRQREELFDGCVRRTVAEDIIDARRQVVGSRRRKISEGFM